MTQTKALFCARDGGSPWCLARLRANETRTAARRGESDPIRCWWKADRGAIRVGERFTLVLTCGVIETTSIKVVPAVNQLEPGGDLADAVRGRQRQPPRGRGGAAVALYPVRVLDAAAERRVFRQDINIPALTVTYNLQSPGAGSTEGRDQTYLLPALPMRVLSILPQERGRLSTTSRVRRLPTSNRDAGARRSR
jgi:hypothetical protein